MGGRITSGSLSRIAEGQKNLLMNNNSLFARSPNKQKKAISLTFRFNILTYVFICFGKLVLITESKFYGLCDIVSPHSHLNNVNLSL